MADRSLLARATESTQAPTPGYLYMDIAKNVASSPMACSEVAAYLTRRLSSKNNANVKFKCLKVIAKIAESPITKGQFKRNLAQDSQAMGSIKEALQYRGPPDPARGDEPYAKVRAAAKEALDAIYSDSPTSTSSSADYGGGVGMTMSGGGGGGGGGPRRMEGIGNPMFKDPRLEQQQGGNANLPTTGELLKEAGSTIVGMIRDPLARSVVVEPPRHSSGDMQGFGSHNPPPGRAQLSQATGGQWNMASNRGPQAVGAPANYGKDEGYYKQNEAYDWASKSSGGGAGGVGGSWGAPQSAPGVAGAARVQPSGVPQHQPYVGMTQSSSVQTSTGHGGIAVSDGQYEKSLISELCPPGGMKPEPPPDKLQRFSQSIQSLNPDLVCPALLDCLEDGQPWIMKAKALCVMETAITLGVGEDGVNRYADFFYECRSEIAPLSNHNRPAIRNPAKRVMELLGIASNTGTGSITPATPPAAAPPAAPQADLLDFGGGPPAPPPVAPPPPPTTAPPPPPAASGSLFGGLTVQGKSAPAAPVPQASMFDSMTVKSAPAAPAPAASGFGFMDESPPSAVPSTPAPSGSAFGFMQETPPAAPAPAAAAAPSDSAFGFMQETPPAGAGSSAFDFMQGPTPPSPQQKATFDPFAHNYQPSPTSQQRMIQQQPVNPAQINNLYTQQNMLMMQRQMQQMQMAMAMQNQGNLVLPQQPQQQQRQGSNPNVMAPGGFAATTSFSFLDGGGQAPKKKEIKSFDFVQDAMKSEKKTKK